MESEGSDFQKLYTMMGSQSGTEDTHKYLSGLLKCYLPPSGWPVYKEGVTFLQNLGLEKPRIIKVRTEFLAGANINLGTKLVYPAEAYAVLFEELCEDLNVSFKIVSGFNLLQSPKEGNYILGLILITCCARKCKSFIIDAIIEKMQAVKVQSGTTVNTLAPVNSTSLADKYFEKHSKNTITYLDEHDIIGERFSFDHNRKMGDYIASITSINSKKKQIAVIDANRKAARAQLGNKKAKNLNERLGLAPVMAETLRAMESETEESGFFNVEDEIVIENDPEKIKSDNSYDLIGEINSMTVAELLKNLILLTNDKDYKLYLRGKIASLRNEELLLKEAMKGEARRFLNDN